MGGHIATRIRLVRIPRNASLSANIGSQNRPRFHPVRSKTSSVLAFSLRVPLISCALRNVHRNDPFQAYPHLATFRQKGGAHMIEQGAQPAAATAGSPEPGRPASDPSAVAANARLVGNGIANPKRTTASIPPRISLKTGPGKSLNTGKLRFHAIEIPHAYVPTPDVGRNWRRSENLNRNSEEIPHRISLKTGRRKSLNSNKIEISLLSKHRMPSPPIRSSNRIGKRRENPERTTASIPPRISLKTGRGKSPNTGRLHSHAGRIEWLAPCDLGRCAGDCPGGAAPRRLL